LIYKYNPAAAYNKQTKTKKKQLQMHMLTNFPTSPFWLAGWINPDLNRKFGPLTGEAGSVEPGYWRRKIRSRPSPSTPEAAVPVETLKPPLLQSTPKTERKNNPIVAIDQQRRHIDSRQKTALAWRSNPAIQHQHFTEAQKPPPPQSDWNPKEENQKLETGKTSADTLQNRFSISKRTRKKTTSPTQKGRENTTSPSWKGREKTPPLHL
jgi:hypothetical protein